SARPQGWVEPTPAKPAGTRSARSTWSWTRNLAPPGGARGQARSCDAATAVGCRSDLSHLDVAAVLALERPLQLVEGRVLDLADPLARQVVLVPDLAERALLVIAEPEALGEH